MFGYVMPRMEDLSQEERERYHAAYCGVCRALGERCGQRCRVALTYDMTFLALLLGSLYEPDERQGSRRCAPHPVRPHAYLGSDCIDYAADMTVAGASRQAKGKPPSTRIPASLPAMRTKHRSSAQQTASPP